MKYPIIGIPALKEIEPRGEHVTVWHADGRRFRLTTHGARSKADPPSTIAFMLGGRTLKLNLVPSSRGDAYKPEPTAPTQLRPSTN